MEPGRQSSPGGHYEQPALAVSAAPSGTTGGTVWAVGSYYDGSVTRTLVERWAGSGWSVVPSPNMGALINELYSVVAIEGNDVWAVGRFSDSTSSGDHTLTEHWDGSTWSVVSSPNEGTLGSILYGVTDVSTNNVWAVGNYETGTYTDGILTEHWNGTAWSIVPSPNQATDVNDLSAITAVSASDIWAVGLYGILHGSQVYEYPLVEHWDGTTWSIVPSNSPSSTFNQLIGVTAASANDIWTVGLDSVTDSGGRDSTLVGVSFRVALSLLPSLPYARSFSLMCRRVAPFTRMCGVYHVGTLLGVTIPHHLALQVRRASCQATA